MLRLVAPSVSWVSRPERIADPLGLLLGRLAPLECDELVGGLLPFFSQIKPAACAQEETSSKA
jgi:hypothetical protein